MRVKILRVPTEWLEKALRFHADLPEDAELLSASQNAFFNKNEWGFKFKSESFDDVPKGKFVPVSELQPMNKTEEPFITARKLILSALTMKPEMKDQWTANATTWLINTSSSPAIRKILLEELRGNKQENP